MKIKKVTDSVGMTYIEIERGVFSIVDLPEVVSAFVELALYIDTKEAVLFEGDYYE